MLRRMLMVGSRAIFTVRWRRKKIASPVQAKNHTCSRGFKNDHFKAAVSLFFERMV